MKKKTSNHAGKIRPILQLAARMIKKDPTLLDDLDAENKDNQLARLRWELKQLIPELADPSHCANCGASMAEYIRRVDIFAAMLLVNMGRIVKKRISDGVPFTLANKIAVFRESSISTTQKNNVTNVSKLGLVAKYKENGKHIDSQWVVTARGWAALRGEAVPAEVRVFRNQILERTDETTTLPSIFSGHRSKMDERARRRQSMRHDHRHEFVDYDTNEWVEIAGMHQGNLL